MRHKLLSVRDRRVIAILCSQSTSARSFKCFAVSGLKPSVHVCREGLEVNLYVAFFILNVFEEQRTQSLRDVFPSGSYSFGSVGVNVARPSTYLLNKENVAAIKTVS